MGTEKRQRAITKRLKRKDARNERKARERRVANKTIRILRAAGGREGFDAPVLTPLPLPSSIWHNIVRRLGL
jgi:hypothetical protein